MKTTASAPTTLYGYDGLSYSLGDRVEIHPNTDAWMKGDRYGEVTVADVAKQRACVVLDKSGRKAKGAATNFRRIACAALLALLPLAAHAVERCAPYTLNGKPVVAKRTEAGNLSTTACEKEITIRLRSGRPDKRALNGAIPHKAGGNIILRKVTLSECTVWIYEDPKAQDHSTVMRAWDLCVDSMHHALEQAVPK